MQKPNFWIFLAIFIFIGCTSSETRQLDYLKIIQNYADVMLEKGRDTYGETHSPLFAAALDRQNFQPGTFQDIEGIRNGDRALSGANPMHDLNLYQILYALAEITGDTRYATEADRTLKFFFETCQSPATGLLAWGEHIGWNFTTEQVQGNTHEFFRPWVLWDRSYQLAPEAVVRFARGLWEHQIGNHETGEFSRHASWDSHKTGGQNEYPRHGGFYIMTWAKAYRETQDLVFAHAVETLVEMYNRLSSKETGAIPCSSNPQRARIMWPESNLSLAVDLTDAADALPANLQQKMLARAAKTDSVYLALPHDFSPAGIGFVAGADIHTLGSLQDGEWTHTKPWVTGYGKATDAQVANLCFLRYGQLKESPQKNAFRKLMLDCAARYLTSAPELSETIYPGPLGDVIFNLLAAFELTGESRFIDRAGFFAKIAVENFLTDGVALPKASSQHEHYEAITRGDTMMMALLKLWQLQNRPEAPVRLVYCDR